MSGAANACLTPAMAKPWRASPRPSAASARRSPKASTGRRFALLPGGAARNALDCALIDLEAKIAGKPAHVLLGCSPPSQHVTCYTLSLGTPESMEEAARTASHRALLKVKLGGDGDVERIAAVRRGAPNSRLVVDANEAWRADTLRANLEACASAGVELIEQPLPAGKDDALAGIVSPIPLCADESMHDSKSLAHLPPWYSAINIKLDKTGGLTDALELRAAALAKGLKIMVGCMVGTSLAMAPAFSSRKAQALSISTGPCCSRRIASRRSPIPRASWPLPRPASGAEARQFGNTPCASPQQRMDRRVHPCLTNHAFGASRQGEVKREHRHGFQTPIGGCPRNCRRRAFFASPLVSPKGHREGRKGA